MTSHTSATSEPVTRYMPASLGAHLAGATIPCCVPYWDAKRFFAAGGSYSETLGYYISARAHDPAFASDFEEWLPRKWQYRGVPPLPVLLPDMLPSTTWEMNLRTQLSESEWDRLRKFCYQAAGNTCVACGSRGDPHVEAHESWRFDEKTGVQSLKGLLCLCPLCHKAKHLGYARRIGRLAQVYEQLKWLNDWDDVQLDRALVEVEVRQQALSERSWQLDLSFLRSFGVR